MATWRIPLPLSQVRRASKSAVKVLKVRSSLPSGVITQATTVALWISSPAHRSWITSISPPCTEWVWRPDEQRLWYACSPEIGWHNSWCLWAAKVTLRNRLAVRRAVDLLAPLHFHSSWCRTAAWLATRGKRIRRGSAYNGEAHTRGKRIRGESAYVGEAYTRGKGLTLTPAPLAAVCPYDPAPSCRRTGASRLSMCRRTNAPMVSIACCPSGTSLAKLWKTCHMPSQTSRVTSTPAA